MEAIRSLMLQLAAYVAPDNPSGYIPRLKANGNWVLDSGENYFAQVKDCKQGRGTQEVQISYRYENPEFNQAFNGLAVWLEYQFYRSLSRIKVDEL
jgi:hypothetical protein